MKDAKEDSRDPVSLIATERGFYSGSMVEPGEKFLFDPMVRGEGKPPLKLPKWAVPSGEYRPKPKRKEAFDTKPIAAQAAVRKKAAQAAGTDDLA